MRDAFPTEAKLIDQAPSAEDAVVSEPVRERPAELLFRRIPALDSLRHYSARILGLDAMAGLTVATVAVPQAMAYALTAGLPPQYGLYTAIVMTAVGALFDSSKQLINGPTNAISIAVLSALMPIAGPDKVPAAVLLALLVGLIQMGITLLRLGDLTRYISQAVIVGFTLGAAVLLVLDQLHNLLGLREVPAEYFLTRFWLTLTQGGEVHGWTLGLGLGTILFVIGLRTLNTRMGRRLLPEFLLAVILMAALVWLFELDKHGVRVAGEIPARLPAFALPDVEWTRVRGLANSALAIALLGLLEAIAMAKAIAAQTGQKLDINQQCLSEGVANLAGSFFQCYPGSGSLTRSVLNQQAGAVTQWSGVISAGAVAGTVLLFGPFAYYIPRAALAGILMLTAWRMVDRQQLLYHLRATRFDAGIVLVTALAAVAVSIEFCILIGVFLSFILYVPRAARVHLTELVLTPERVIRERVPNDPSCGRILLFNLEGEFFFGSAPDLDKHLTLIANRAGEGIRVIVLRLKRARNPDAVCLGLLDAFLRRMQSQKISVLLCGVRLDMAKVFHTTGIEARLGKQHIFCETLMVGSSTLDAVRAAYDLVANDVCPQCPRRDQLSAGGKEDWYYMI